MVNIILDKAKKEREKMISSTNVKKLDEKFIQNKREIDYNVRLIVNKLSLIDYDLHN